MKINPKEFTGGYLWCIYGWSNNSIYNRHILFVTARNYCITRHLLLIKGINLPSIKHII